MCRLQPIVAVGSSNFFLQERLMEHFCLKHIWIAVVGQKDGSRSSNVSQNLQPTNRVSESSQKKSQHRQAPTQQLQPPIMTL